MDNQPLNPLTVVAQMMRAAMDGDLEKCQRLIQKGADIRVIADSHGRTPLLEAAECGHVDLCRLFLESGASPNRATIGDDSYNPKITGTAPLYSAATRGHVAICRLLVEHGADLHRLKEDAEEFQYTPLQAAVMFGQVDVVRYFVDECGEDIDQRTQAGLTLDQLARTFSKYDLAEFLVTYRHSLQTGKAISDAFDAEESPHATLRSSGPSPL